MIQSSVVNLKWVLLFSMSCVKERETLMKICELYKEMPYLWQKEHKNYTNKDMRLEGFSALLDIYKTFDETATIKTVKKKIENMRTYYTKELKKVVSSKHTASGSEEVYTPSLWYFDALSFLGSGTESSRVTTDPPADQKWLSSDEDVANVGTSSSSSTYKRKREEESPHQKHAKLVCSAEKNLSQKEEECEAFGRSIGLQMKDLDKRQLIIAQKIISDTIFYARLNKLREDSYVVTSPSFPL